MELLNLLNFKELFVQIAGFMTLFLLLRRYFWRKMLAFLDGRREKVASEYTRIEETRAELASIKADYAKRIAAIDELAQRKINEAVAEGRVITDDLRKKAHQEAQAIINAARESVRFELLKTKETMKGEIIDLSMKTAENLIQERLTEADDRRIVEDFLKKLDSI